MCALVPSLKERRDAAFPIFAPVTLVPPAVAHVAEEDDPQRTEEQEKKENRETDRPEWIEEVRVTEAMSIRVAISVHRWDELPASCRPLNGFCHLGSLCNAVSDSGAIDRDPSPGEQTDQEQDSDQPKYKTVA